MSVELNRVAGESREVRRMCVGTFAEIVSVDEGDDTEWAVGQILFRPYQSYSATPFIHNVSQGDWCALSGLDAIWVRPCEEGDKLTITIEE